MKIAFLMQESKMGGIEYNSLHLADAMDAKRFRVTFICPGEGKLTRQLRKRGTPYLLYRRGRFLSTSTRVFNRYVFNPAATLYDLALFPGIALRLSGLLKQGNFDLVVTKGLLANLYGSLASRMSRIPCVWDMQDVVSKDQCFGFNSWLLDAWARIFADRLTASSEAIRNQFSEKVRNKTALIPNGIDTEEYRPNLDPRPVRKEWGVKPNEFLVGHIARFTYWKGQLDFIRAAGEISRKFHGVKFVLVGAPVFDDDSYEKRIKKLARKLELGERVIFPGFRDDLAAVLAALDVFVHSSIEPEGCPLTLLTAMAMGKPVVATNVVGNSEIITRAQQGILVEPKRPSELARAISKIIHDASLARSLGKNARERILKGFSLGAYAKDCEKVFLAVGGPYERHA